VRKTRERLGRGSILFAVTSLLLSTSAVIPAQAVNKAGAACTKLNSKAKIGKESFVCAKNPIAKSTKRIWVWADCLVANKSYIDGLASQKELEATAAKTISILNLDIKNLELEVATKEAEAKTWDAKAAEYIEKADTENTKAAELKASAAKGGITSVDPKFKTALQLALLDKKLTSIEINQLAASWSTTIEKVPFIIEFLSAEDRLKSAKSYLSGATNAQRKAAYLRSKDIIELKQSQIKRAESNVLFGKSNLSSLKSTRAQACDPKIWTIVSR
jgi:hypothetical protein